ncbi:MAG: outer membrane beta-barrel protein [Methylovirgula sp.]
MSAWDRYRLYPYVETATGYDSNPNLLNTDVKGSPYIYGETGLKLQSDWSQSSLAADLHGGYYDYLTDPTANQPNATGTITGRIDVTRQSQINLQTTFSLTEGTPGSPLLSVPNAVFVTSRPPYASIGQTLGFTQQFNRLSVSINSAFAHYFFGNATQSDGTDLQLALNNYNAYSVAGRVSYELTPALIPYVQVTGTRNQYDSSMDVDGFDRSSNGVLAQVGTTYEVTRLLTGDISVGYDQRFYADPRLPVARAPTVNASLHLRCDAADDIDLHGSDRRWRNDAANSSAVVAHTLSLKISHDLLRNLTLAATGTYQINNYIGEPEIDQFIPGYSRPIII